MLGEEKFISNKKGRKEERTRDRRQNKKNFMTVNRLQLTVCACMHVKKTSQMYVRDRLMQLQRGLSRWKGQTCERIQGWKCVSITSRRRRRRRLRGRPITVTRRRKEKSGRGRRRDNWAQRECMLMLADARIGPLTFPYCGRKYK